MKRTEILNQCEKWLEDLVVTCKTDKRAGKNVTGGADPVTVFKVTFISSSVLDRKLLLCRAKIFIFLHFSCFFRIT